MHLENPLASDEPRVWEKLLDAVGPASILVVIGNNISGAHGVELAPEDVWQETLLRVWREDND